MVIMIIIVKMVFAVEGRRVFCTISLLLKFFPNLKNYGAEPCNPPHHFLRERPWYIIQLPLCFSCFWDSCLPNHVPVGSFFPMLS